MGTKKDTQMNVLMFRWLKKMPIKVQIFLGTLLVLCALVAVSYNVRVRNLHYFFLASEAVHLIGIIVLIYKLFTKNTCSGLSLKTQELTALVLALKFIIHSGLMKYNIYIYTVIDLISLLSTLLAIWMIRFKLKSSYIKELDKMPLSFLSEFDLCDLRSFVGVGLRKFGILRALPTIRLVVPCAALAIIIHPHASHLTILLRILSAFCVYLEAVAVLPQIRFLQNAKMVETFTGYYVFALGVSRLLALTHWIIQIYKTRGGYLFLLGSGHVWGLAALLSEMVRSFILADFCYYYIKSFKQGQLLRKIPV